MTIVKILFDLKSEKTFYYNVPKNLEASVKIYQRVRVEFGEKKAVGFVYQILNKGQNKEVLFFKSLKDVLQIIDLVPILNEEQLRIAEFIARHYICSLGQAVFRILPSAKLEKAALQKDYLETDPTNLLPKLLPEQQKIINDFNLATKRSIKKLQTHLIFGVTGSGKTRIYLELIDTRLQEGVGVMLLLPEIALTYQFLNILKPPL